MINLCLKENGTCRNVCFEVSMRGVGENVSFMSLEEIGEKNKISCSLIANLVCVYSIEAQILNVLEFSISNFK